MAREITLKVGKKSHKLVGSFKAGERISADVADLMMVQREASLAQMMADKGIPYNARWQMTLANVVDILAIGCECSGADVDRDTIETECFAMGFDVAHNKALEYLQLFFAVPENMPDTSDKEPEGGK